MNMTNHQDLQKRRKNIKAQSKILSILGFLLFLIAAVLLFYILVFKINSDGAKCLNNPLTYGANQLKEANKKELVCSCNLMSDKPTPTLYFNYNSSWIERSYPDVKPAEIDFNITILNTSL